LQGDSAGFYRLILYIWQHTSCINSLLNPDKPFRMFIFYGTRNAKIKRYTDNHQSCNSCRGFDFDVKVYRKYYHLYLLPIVPIGEKAVEIRCKNCTEPLRLESVEKHYAKMARTPFFLYSGLILFVALGLLLVNANRNMQKEKVAFVSDPHVGDVYTIRKEANDTTSYYFLRISRIKGDTVFTYHSNFEYKRAVSSLDTIDFFTKEEELFFHKKELKKMLEKDEINAVERNYGDGEGFNRIR
jgi:hypothetical protein